jgi:conjugal transfer pilus assembly protein TraK
MKKLLLTTLAILPSVLSAQTVVHPDSPLTVTLSNTDINRIVCQDGVVNDVFYSDEKGLTVVNKAGNAFVKYLVKQTPDGNEYVTSSTEIHVVCDGKTYTVIAQPSQVNAKTIVLSGGSITRVSKNIAQYGGLDHEERLISLTRQVYKNEIDENFVIKHINKPLKVLPKDIAVAGLFQNLAFIESRQITMEGVNLRATEYQITARSQLVRFTETDFLVPDLGHSIAGITLSKHSLNPGESGRLIVVTNEAL